MYFVGIDISKFKHDCAIIDELGDVITSSWSFNNDCEGFSLFRDLLNALDGEKKIGFESTGHYGHNLKLFLESQQLLVHGDQSTSDFKICSQQIPQKNEDRYSGCAIHSPISHDGRVQTLSTVILSHGSAKVINEISRFFGSSAFQTACGAHKHPG